LANIKLVRLLSGENIVADVYPSGEQLKLKKPVQLLLMPGPTQTSPPKLNMMPWPNFSDATEIFVGNDKVLFSVDPTKELHAAYTQAMSGLITPQQSFISTR
jgi:hypothetical protein